MKVTDGEEREKGLKRELEAQRIRHRQLAFENAKLTHELRELQKQTATDQENDQTSCQT